MKAFVLDKYKHALKLRDVAEPKVGSRDVLVEVKAAGVNQLDEKIRMGEFKAFLPYSFPLILGNDLAGVVIAVGAEVTKFSMGDEVYGRPDTRRIGTFAERIAVSEDDVALKPSSLTTIEAGAVPLVALTAWQALVERAKVQPGQKVLIHAGAGGVGSIAIQLAKHLGATVATTASAGNADFVRELGADVVIDYRTQDFSSLLHGYDVVLDSLGGDHLLDSIDVLAPGGVVIGISGPPDTDFAREIGANAVIRTVMAVSSAKARRRARRAGVSYSFLFMRASGEQLRALGQLFDSGALRPVIGRTVAFSDTPLALQQLSDGGVRGKTVITYP